MAAATGPAFILMWCTASEGLKVAYFSDTLEGRKALRASLANLGESMAYFVRVYREMTEEIVADFGAVVH